MIQSAVVLRKLTGAFACDYIALTLRSLLPVDAAPRRPAGGEDRSGGGAAVRPVALARAGV
ncbi:MAG TPA: hypothetical protein VM891_14365 [Amaricoccus sp.]|jgi:hypothetical protein|nr:hypothetical protein [Amaricoccus sp.]